MKLNVITEIVENNLCIGCGLCAALCPEGALEIAWNQCGEYNAVEAKLCVTECGLCLKICPFEDHDEDEDTIGKELYSKVQWIGHHSKAGYYLATYVGYADKHRPTSASGGMATWLLEKLLAEGIVDHAVCVAPTGDPERLFSFTVFDNPESVRAGAGSAYYPVEMSGVIRNILATPGRYAVTGLPCFIKAIRLAQKKIPKLRERIVVTIGLVCGQMKSKHFTEYIASLAGLNGKVKSVRYRGKSSDQPASNFHFAFTSMEGDELRILSNEGIAEAWTNRWFAPKACNYCDDVFAECADVAFMDAWLSEYLKDSRGTSLVLVRSPQVQEVIAHGKGINLNSIPIARMVQSQAGVVAVKRQHLAYRLFLNYEKKNKVLKKRVTPEMEKNPFVRREIIIKDNMTALSRKVWADSVHDAKSLREAMLPDMKRLAGGSRIERVIAFPLKAILYIKREIGGRLL